MKATLKLGFWSLLTVAILLGGYGYWHHLSYYPSTDDAYIKANVVNISPNINGHVEAVFIRDNQEVKKGTLLYTIDQRPYAIALKHAVATLDLTQQQIQSTKAAILIAKAKLEQAKTQYALDKKNAHRIEILVKEGKASIASGDDVSAKLATSHQAIIVAQNTYLQALSQLGKEGEDNANLRASRANVKKAELDLNYTQIKAPTDGKISQLTLRVGDMVHQGQTVFSMIEKQHYWVEANFKETQLERIRVGQPVEIALDMYPHDRFKGTVQSISGSTGSSFSILPPENATGNWVKVTQRIPVKITFKDAHVPLALGASANVKIDTKHPLPHTQHG
jgi:membrane fusion protein (multidrug efflux system)